MSSSLRKPFLKSKLAILSMASFCLGGCASYNGRDLQPGQATQAQVEARMGVPAQRWKESDGSEVLAYPRGPAGYHTYMARFDAAGRLVGLENVLEPRHFARIQSGMGQEEVLRVLGPPYAPWTVYFKAREELVWEWRYCDDWGEPARFNVFFDGATGKVRSTGSLTESQRFGGGFGLLGGMVRQWCSR